MWFEDSRRKKKKRGKRVRVLNFAASPSRRRGANLGRISLVIVTLLLVALAAAGCWWATVLAMRALFAENNYYNIRRMEIQEGQIVTASLIRDWSKINEGTNIFSFSIGRVRNEIMKNSSNISNLEIRRELPDILHIDVFERIPVAMIDRRNGLAVDEDGYVFRSNAAAHALPLLRGYHTPSDIVPNRQLTGNSRAALRVLRLCEDPALGLLVSTVDLSHPEHLILYLGEQGKVVKLAWPGMHKDNPESRRRLRVRLGELSRILHTPRGQAMTRLDATIEGRIDAY